MDSVSPPNAPIPRRKRRWVRFMFWTGVALIALWLGALLMATWDLQRATESLKSRGKPVSFGEALAQIQSSASVPNGADFLRRAVQENERLGKPGDLASSVGTGSTLPYSPQEVLALTPLLANGERLNELLDQAVASTPGPLTEQGDLAGLKNPYQFDHVQEIRSLARLLWADARFSASTGDFRRAFRRLKTQYRLSEQLSSEAFIMPQLIRLSIISLANHAVRTSIPLTGFSSEELAELADLAARIDRKLMVAPALVNERAMVSTVFQDQKALAEEMRDIASSTFRSGVARNHAFVFMEYRWIDLITSPLGLPARRRAAAQALNIPNDVLDLADKPPPWPQERKQTFEAWNEALNIGRLSINGSPEGGASMLTYAALRIHRQLAMVQLALRLRRFDLLHGKLPDRLEDLCDASMPELPMKWFEGKPFVYTKKGRSFTLTANPSITPEIALTNNQQREAWGLLLEIDADAAKSQSSPSK